jgi:3-hydroxybutyryl-CoA dehydrogenase
MKNISVIGSGTMGNGIAHIFAQFGYQVNLIDVNESALQKAIATITKNLDRQVQKNSITEEIKNSTLKNISTFSDLSKACVDADLVIEAASENIDIKLNIFKQLDAKSSANRFAYMPIQKHGTYFGSNEPTNFGLRIVLGFG